MEKAETFITFNTTIANKYHKGFKRTTPIDEIVIHGTGGGSTGEGLLKWMENYGRVKEYTKGIALFHYLIDREGKITQIIDPENWVYHSTAGRNDEKTIGIELLNPTSDNSGDYTSQQYESLSRIILLFIEKYQITKITSHGWNAMHYSGQRKNCPGNNFNLARIKALLQIYEYDFQDISGMGGFSISQIAKKEVKI